MEVQVIKVSDAARMKGVTRSTIWAWARAGQIRHERDPIDGLLLNEDDLSKIHRSSRGRKPQQIKRVVPAPTPIDTEPRILSETEVVVIASGVVRALELMGLFTQPPAQSPQTDPQRLPIKRAATRTPQSGYEALRGDLKAYGTTSLHTKQLSQGDRLVMVAMIRAGFGAEQVRKTLPHTTERQFCSVFHDLYGFHPTSEMIRAVRGPDSLVPTRR